MIYLRLRGNIAQGMFQIYFVSKLAQELDQEFALYYNGSLHNSKYSWLKVKDREPFNKFKYVERYPSYLPVIFEKDPYDKNIYEITKERVKKSLEKYGMAAIEGWFQYRGNFDVEYARELFKVSEEKIDALREKYTISNNTLCVIAIQSNSLLKQYFLLNAPAHIMKTYNKWEGDKKYDKIIVVSNKPEDCKKYYADILPEKTVFSDSDDVMELVYLPGLCKDIFLSFDAYSWWAAVLSDYKNKDMAVPTQGGSTLFLSIKINDKKFTYEE